MKNMKSGTQTILVVDSNPDTRARVARELAPTGCKVLEAGDGMMALEIVRNRRVRLVVSELFLKTAESDCLIQAIRLNRVHGTRMLAHTVHRKASVRDWARLWGASGFLVQPTRTERLRHVVTKLLTKPAATAGMVRTSRRDTLSGALAEIERGELPGTSAIVVGRSWWNGLSGSERNGYRRSARRNGVSLRSDSMMSPSFVELRRESQRKAGMQARKQSPYRT